MLSFSELNIHSTHKRCSWHWHACHVFVFLGKQVFPFNPESFMFIGLFPVVDVNQVILQFSQSYFSGIIHCPCAVTAVDALL